MIKKKQEIVKFIKLVNNIFGSDVLTIVDHWEDTLSIGFQKDDKLVYVSLYAQDSYFYECELLVDDPEIVYISQGCDNANAKQLLDAMSKFFEIKFIDKKYQKDL